METENFESLGISCGLMQELGVTIEVGKGFRYLIDFFFFNFM